MEKKSEFKLNDPPRDTISAVKFCSNSNQYLLASSWDCSVRLFDIDSNTTRYKHMYNSPVLDCVYKGQCAVSGGLDSKVKLVDLNTKVESIVGDHECPINCIEYASNVNGIFSGSWDKTVKIWDTREKECVGTYQQCNGKVYSMNIVDEKIAVGTSERRVLIWDMRNMKNYLIVHQLRHQPKSIKISPNKKVYVIGSNDGRVAVEYIKRDPEIRKLRYVFRCHRMRSNDSEYVFRVNCISFHNVYNTFATGGSNGFVNIWDGFNKQRLCQLKRYPTCIASLNFSKDGTKLAIACSDLNILDKPLENIIPPAIYVRNVNEQNVKS